MPSHHDYGIDCETFCGGTPDDDLFDGFDPRTAGWTGDDQAAYDAWLNEEAAVRHSEWRRDFAAEQAGVIAEEIAAKVAASGEPDPFAGI